MATLYDIALELRDILDTLDECETDVEIEHIMDMANAVESDLSRKAEQYVRVMRNYQTDIDALKAEKERLDKMMKRREHAIERMKEYIRAAMTTAGVDKVETPLGKWSRRMAPWSATVLDESKVPDVFKIPQPPKIDKAALLREFKATGELFDGVEFNQKEYVMFK